MKHVIIGCGVIGSAFASWLQEKKEQVAVNDINKKQVVQQGFTYIEKEDISEYTDLIWVCTAEWNVKEVLQSLQGTKVPIIIRSTIKPRQAKQYKKEYDIEHIAHMPEFLTEQNAIKDIFNEDRYIIGTEDEEIIEKTRMLLAKGNAPIFYVTLDEAALIKLVANNWLATQISYWNEIKTLCDTYDAVTAQRVADAVTTDKRISKYGSRLSGKPFTGFCLPKDLRALLQVYDAQNVPAPHLTATQHVNKQRGEEKNKQRYKCLQCNRILTMEEEKKCMGFCPRCNREVIVVDL